VTDFPTLFVHIGVPKTATTTIQDFFTRNRELLIKRGILYPRSVASKSGLVELHRGLGAALEVESVPWLADMPKYSSRDLFSCLHEEVRRTNCKAVVLSSEALAFMRRPERLRDALAPYSMHVLVYIRRQDVLLASLYNQLIKSRLYSAPFDQYLREAASGSVRLADFDLALDFCRYNELLGRWRTAIGANNISVARYEDYALPAGILEHIAAQVGFDLDGLAVSQHDTNPSLPLPLLALKRRVNSLLMGEAQRVCAETAFSGLEDRTPHLSPLTADEVADERRKRLGILSPYNEGNADVAKAYFSGRHPLFEEPTGRELPLPDRCDEPTLLDPLAYLSARLIACQSVAALESLPDPPNTNEYQAEWDGIDGLYVHRLPTPNGNGLATHLQLIAAPTEGRHRLGIRFRLPTSPGVYCVEALLRPAGARYAYIELRDGTELNYAVVIADICVPSIVTIDGACRNARIGATINGWIQLSTELDFADDLAVAYVGILSRDMEFSYVGDIELRLQLAHIEMEKINAR
jgi:hypothetical protein